MEGEEERVTGTTSPDPTAGESRLERVTSEGPGDMGGPGSTPCKRWVFDNIGIVYVV